MEKVTSDAARAALEKAYAALIEVEEIEHTNWTRHTPGFYDETVHFVSACAWCHEEAGHADDCPRQAALHAIEEVL